MKSILVFTSAIALTIGAASAATIAVGRGIGNPGVIAMTASGDALASGGYSISVGTFTTSGTTQEPVITSDFSTLLAAVASFDVFASGLSPITGATTGTITGSFTSQGGVAPADFNLKPIYFMISAVTPQGTEFGFFKMTSNPAFPADVTAGGSTPVTLSNGTLVVPLANAGKVNGNNFQLVAVPEPSSLILGMMGVLGLLRRKRG